MIQFNADRPVSTSLTTPQTLHTHRDSGSMELSVRRQSSVQFEFKHGLTKWKNFSLSGTTESAKLEPANAKINLSS
jgi:hypothetical protein